ncbi:MAG: DUF1800 family protein [Acidobacteria bacterium]|nr:DUF1800 family protein [Acidobacteriota bacterium]
MARTSDREIEHLLRRAGFGARPDELDMYGQMSVPDAVDLLVNFTDLADSVDSRIGTAGYVNVTTRGQFAPQSNITDSRQRWLFRMVHSDRPLQEKMALFWHNHFATGYTKIAGALGAAEGARYMAAKPGEDPGRVRGQIEMLRENALGNFRDILVNIAKDVAMLVWLDGRTNTRAKPQENFAREIMTRPRRPSAFRSARTGATRFRLARRRTGCRTASISSTRSPPIRTPPAISRRSCIASSSPTPAP